jgi:hypothetical protein
MLKLVETVETRDLDTEVRSCRGTNLGAKLALCGVSDEPKGLFQLHFAWSIFGPLHC